MLVWNKWVGNGSHRTSIHNTKHTNNTTLNTHNPSYTPLQFQEEERHHNEAGLVTLVCDCTSIMAGLTLFVRDVEGRTALNSTISRLFEGLSDIAKAVLIILIADTVRWGCGMS